MSRNFSPTLQLTQELVRIPSWVDGESNEQGVALFLEERFQSAGYTVERQYVSEKRWNVIAFRQSPAIVFLGHMDTVPLSAGDDTEALGTFQGTRLYGRGAVDMKAGLALMIRLASTSQREDLAFVCTVDEEYSFAGMQRFLEDQSWEPLFVFNPEPTDGAVYRGCRGVTELQLAVQGKSAHAGRKTLGVNAPERIFTAARTLEKKLRRSDADGLQSSVNIAAIQGGLGVPSDLWQGSVQGAGNVVPDFSRALIEVRLGNPRLTQEELEQCIMDSTQQVGLELLALKSKFFYGGYASSLSVLKQLVPAFERAQVPLRQGNLNRSGYFEVQQLAQVWDCPCIVLGPGPAALAHQPGEYVDTKSVESVERVYQCLLEILPQKQ